MKIRQALIRSNEGIARKGGCEEAPGELRGKRRWASPGSWSPSQSRRVWSASLAIDEYEEMEAQPGLLKGVYEATGHIFFEKE